MSKKAQDQDNEETSWTTWMVTVEKRLSSLKVWVIASVGVDLGSMAAGSPSITGGVLGFVVDIWGWLPW